MVADERDRLLLVARVDVHLPAAGLAGREGDLVAETLQQPDGRPPDRRVQRVAEAGDEQGDAHQSAGRIRRATRARPRLLLRASLDARIASSGLKITRRCWLEVRSRISSSRSSVEVRPMSS